MTAQQVERPTTPAGSSSPTSSPDQPQPAAGVSASPMLGVRPTPSESRAKTGFSPDYAAAAGVPGPAPSDPLDETEPGTRSGFSDDVDGGERSTSRVNLSKRPLRDVVRGGALGAGEFLHDHLATTPAEQDAGLWLMDDDQAAAIADPLASVAGRYAGGQVVDTTVAELIKAGVGVAAYLVVNILQRFKIRRALKRAGYQLDPDPED